MRFLIGLVLLLACNSAEARFPRGTPASSLPRGDVICDASTGVATGVGSGTCMTTVARCYGDVTSTTVNVDTTNFNPVMRVYGNVFSAGTTPSGDVGKTVNIPNGGSTGPWIIQTVGAFNGTYQDITMTTNIRGTQANNSVTLSWGTDDAPAFATFNDWAVRVWQASNSGLVEMYLPSGKNCQILTDSLNIPYSNYDPQCGSNGGTASYGYDCRFGGSRWAKGIKKFLMNFAGSSVVSPTAFTRLYNLSAGSGVCQVGISYSNGCTARTASASIGDTAVFLTDTTQCSRFTVGNYMFMTGYDTQGLYNPTGGYSFPPNPAFYDHVKVTSLANCATGLANGRVDIDRPLTNNYLSTWPLNGPGGPFEADQGGPATAYALAFWWDTETEYRGGTLGRQLDLTNDAGRKIVFRDITWSAPPGTPDYGCAYATQNTDWIIIGGDWTNCKIEVDKIVINQTIQNSQIYRMDNQSTSPRYTTMSDTTIGVIDGTGRNWTGSNVTVTTGASPGVKSFGRSDSFSCTNCSIAGAPTVSNAQATGTATSGTTWSVTMQSGGTQSATMSGGVLTLPIGYGAAWWAVPGTNFTWAPSGSISAYVYQVLDVTQDPTNQYITTNCVGINTVCGASGNLPVSSGTLNWKQHPSPKFNCVGCASAGSGSGWAAVSDGPTDAPLYSYARFTADATWVNGARTFMLWGKLQSIVATVTSAYPGGTPSFLNFNPTGQFAYGVMSQTGATGNYVPVISLGNANTRTITSSGCSGGSGGTCATDASFSYTYNPQWMRGAITPYMSSSSPPWVGSTTMTFTTDQGVVNP